jgi:hypothetical protein
VYLLRKVKRKSEVREWMEAEHWLKSFRRNQNVTPPFSPLN